MKENKLKDLWFKADEILLFLNHYKDFVESLDKEGFVDVSENDFKAVNKIIDNANDIKDYIDDMGKITLNEFWSNCYKEKLSDKEVIK
jgi:predicted transcriptional regulator